MPAERSSPWHANCNDVGMQTSGQFNEHCGFWGCTPHLTFVHPFNKCALVYFVMSMIRKHSASCFTRNLRANSFLTWTDERVTGRFWSGLFFVRCYACTWQRGKRLAVVNTSLHQPTSLWKRLLLWCWATGIRKGKNWFVTAHVAADRLSLVYKQPMWSEAFFMAKNGIWIFLAGINLDHNSMAIEMYFCQINNCHFFPISLFSFEVDCQGFQTRPGAKVQLYRPLNLLFWLNIAQDKAKTVSVVLLLTSASRYLMLESWLFLQCTMQTVRLR